MSNPFQSHHDPVKQALATHLTHALGAEFEATVIYDALEKPPELTMGDYALPCFRFAKLLRRSPSVIAQTLKEQLTAAGDPLIASVEVTGAFLNIFTAKEQIAALLLPSIADGSYFAALKPDHGKLRERVMIEFSQPNTHKEFHVGHLRNVCLGDAITRIFTYNGYDVVPVNYIGDEGTHVAKCLWKVMQHQGERPSSKHAEWYGQRYVEANRALEEAGDAGRPALQREVSQVLAELEAKTGPYYDLWLQSRSECIADFDRIYSWLGVHFDHVFYESQVSEESQAIVDEYLQKGLFVLSEGAVGISMEDEGLGFFMVRKSDGTSLYITKDLALARHKFRDFAIDRSIYVVGNEQNFHFRQLCRALELMGFREAKACYHLSYAHVTLPEGKISSRKGNAFAFSRLTEMLLGELSQHLEKYRGQWTDEEIHETAHKLAVGAIKYGMLAADPQKEIVFDLKAWTSFEGNTGPYLMYSYARTCSILRRCREQGYQAEDTNFAALDHPMEHELLRGLYDFNDVCLGASLAYKPSMIANHLFNLCKSFNRFYAERSVLNAENEQSRACRLALVTAFSTTLGRGLELLGISPAPRM